MALLSDLTLDIYLKAGIQAEESKRKIFLFIFIV